MSKCILRPDERAAGSEHPFDAPRVVAVGAAVHLDEHELVGGVEIELQASADVEFRGGDGITGRDALSIRERSGRQRDGVAEPGPDGLGCFFGAPRLDDEGARCTHETFLYRNASALVASGPPDCPQHGGETACRPGSWPRDWRVGGRP
jgi:hypothetical protein